MPNNYKQRSSESPNVFDTVSVASSQRPATMGEDGGSRNRGGSNRVIKVQSAAFTNTGGPMVANKFAGQDPNPNHSSQLQHRPRVTN